MNTWDKGYEIKEYRCKDCPHFVKEYMSHKNVCMGGHLPLLMPSDLGGCKKLEFNIDKFRKESE